MSLDDFPQKPQQKSYLSPREQAAALFAESLLRLQRINSELSLRLWRDLRPFHKLFSEVE